MTQATNAAAVTSKLMQNPGQTRGKSEPKLGIRASATCEIEFTDYEVPAEACNTWRALWHGLAAFETDMHRHIHLENNILFPRALRLEETAGRA